MKLNTFFLHERFSFSCVDFWKNIDGTDASLTATCNWDGTWTDDPTPKACTREFKCLNLKVKDISGHCLSAAFACGDPPTTVGEGFPSDADQYLDHTFGAPVAYGTMITYTCKADGKLEDSALQNTFDLECLNTGLYDMPPSWPKCKRST